MNLEGTLTKKFGPLPVWVYLLAAVAGGWFLWKKRQASQTEDNGLSADGGGGSGYGSDTASSPDSGTFTGSNTLSVNGDSATMTSAGALLTGGFVGQPGGYQFQQPAGDVYVNVPTPKQVTNVITQKGPDKDTPPPPHSGKRKGTTSHKKSKEEDKKHPKKKSSSSSHKKVTSTKKKSGSGSDSNRQSGNRGGGVSVNLSN